MEDLSYLWVGPNDNECRWCGEKLPVREDGRQTRKYCSNSHKQLAFIFRKEARRRAALRGLRTGKNE